MPDDQKPGRPTDYTQATADAICERLSNGESLRKICDNVAMPGKSTVMRWLKEHSEFRDQYALAREIYADTEFDKILEIADETSGDVVTVDGVDRVNNEAINRSRLRVDARKWVLAKLSPKKYGDKVTTVMTGADDGPVKVEEVGLSEAARVIAFALALGRAAALSASAPPGPSDQGTAQD